MCQIVDPEKFYSFSTLPPLPQSYDSWDDWESWKPSQEIVDLFPGYRSGYDNDGLVGNSPYKTNSVYDLREFKMLNAYFYSSCSGIREVRFAGIGHLAEGENRRVLEILRAMDAD